MINRAICIVMTVLVAMAAAPLMAQTSVSEATRAAEGELTADQKAEVDEFLKFCAVKMTEEAEDVAVVTTVRDVLGRNDSGGAGYSRYFAESMSTTFVPITLKTGASPVVLVNAAISIAAVDTPAIAPALAAMIKDTNPAVRYHGFKGYARIRDRVAGLGSSTRQAMVRTLITAGATEKSPGALRAWFNAMDFSADAFDVASTREANAAVVAALGRRIQAIRNGDTATADAFAFGVQVAGRMAAKLPQAERAETLQVLADVLANAGQSYFDLAKSGQAGKVLPPPSQYLMLLVYCERSLLTVSGQNAAAAIARAIEPAPRERDIIAVKMKVNDLVGTAEMGGLMQKSGVTAPTVLAAGKPVE